jgi:hypothetical protein
LTAGFFLRGLILTFLAKSVLDAPKKFAAIYLYSVLSEIAQYLL